MIGGTNRQRLNGWLALDKPLGLSSTQALAKARRLFGAEKAGHGGTLDPLASGLLPIAFGEATKTIEWAMAGSKTYLVTARWGFETTTDDLEGDIVSNRNNIGSENNYSNLLRSMDHAAMQQELLEVLPGFIGDVQQTPPAFSAIKLGGARAYDLARAGETVDLKSRPVHIDSVKMLSWPSPSETRFEVVCGKGTYIRSLIRDLGRATGWLGHVASLRRLAVGPFHEGDMISLAKLEELRHRDASENSLAPFLRPIETVLDGIPALAVMAPEAQRLRQGQQVLLRKEESLAPAEVVLVTHDGKPLGLCSIEQGSLRPKRMFNL